LRKIFSIKTKTNKHVSINKNTFINLVYKSFPFPTFLIINIHLETLKNKQNTIKSISNFLFEHKSLNLKVIICFDEKYFILIIIFF